MSHLTQSMVEQFFELEKKSARGVLRKEMDSAMDTIFKQMKRKLMMLVESGPDETAHGLAHLGDPTDHEQQLSNDTSHISSTPTNSQAQFGDVNASNLSLQGGSCDRVQDEQQLSSSTNRIPSTSTDSFVPDNANSNQNDEIVVKNKISELVNIIPTPTSSTQSQPSNDNDKDDNLFDELDEDEEDCDCSECMGGLSVNEEEGDDDNGNSQSVEDLIDERNDSVFRPNKRPRLENVQVQDQAQPNKQTNSTQVIIIIRLKCSQCSEMFEDYNKLNAHLISVHSIQKYRGLYKDCNRSFDKPMDLSCNYRTAHSERPNTMWPCGYCSRHFKDSHSLLNHLSMYHEEGVFRCSYAECQFVADLRQKVLHHSRIDHKDFVCEYPGCAKRFSGASILKTHQLTHLNAKPYRCKWPNCKFAGSAYKPNAIKHINTHLKKLVKPKMGTNISDDPNYYLEVHEM